MNDDPDAPGEMTSVIEAHRIGSDGDSSEMVTATYLGRKAECDDHVPGEPHAPCWMISRGANLLRFRVFKSRDDLRKLYSEKP